MIRLVRLSAKSSAHIATGSSIRNYYQSVTKQGFAISLGSFYYAATQGCKHTLASFVDIEKTKSY